MANLSDNMHDGNQNLQTVAHGNGMFLKNGGKFSQLQLKIFLYLISQLPKCVAGPIPALCVSLRTLRAIITDNWDQSVGEVRMDEILKGLASLPASVRESSGYVILTTWFDFIRVSPARDSYVFQFNPVLQPFLMHLTKNFTLYQLGYVLQMRSPNAIRLYDLLKSIAYREEYTMDLDELRFCMGMLKLNEDGSVAERAWPEFKRLSAKVLKPAIEEINKTTDLTVTYEPARTGRDRRATTGITFHVLTKDPPPPIETTLPSARYGRAELVTVNRDSIHVDVSAGTNVPVDESIRAAIFYPAQRELRDGQQALQLPGEEWE